MSKLSLLNTDEYIIATLERHPFYFYGRVAGLLFFFTLPLVAYLIVGERITEGFGGIPTSLFIFVYAQLSILSLIYVFVYWTDYFVDTWIITNTRVIDFDLKGLFHTDVASVSFDNIEDVKVETNGVIESWLGIGNIYLQTAGENREFIFHGARNPEAIKLKIFEAINRQNKKEQQNGELGE